MTLTILIFSLMSYTVVDQYEPSDSEVPEIYDEYSEVSGPELKITNMTVLYAGDTALGR